MGTALAIVFTEIGGRPGEGESGGWPVQVSAEPVRMRTAPQETLAAAADDLAGRTPSADRTTSQVDAERRYHFVSYEVWARGLDDSDGISPRQIRLWLAADGSGKETTAVLPTIATKAFQRSMVGNTSFANATVHEQVFAPGQLRPYIPVPSTDPNELVVQLREIEPAENGTPGVLRAITGLFEQSCPDIAVRVAIFRLLASIDGLTINDHAIDPAGRPGYSLSFIGPAGTDTIYIDPALGLLLSLHQTYTPRGEETQKLHQYQVIQRCGRTHSAGEMP